MVERLLYAGCWRINQSSRPDYAGLENIFGESCHLLQALASTPSPPPTHTHKHKNVLHPTPKHSSFTTIRYIYVFKYCKVFIKKYQNKNTKILRLRLHV